MSQIDPAQESLRHWSVVAPAWEAYRDRLFENTRRNQELVTAAGFADVTVEELAGVMRFESPDDHWTFNTSVAGQLAELVATLSNDNSVPSAPPSTHPWLPSNATADWSSPG
jgi:hypothetical protein